MLPISKISFDTTTGQFLNLNLFWTSVYTDYSTHLTVLSSQAKNKTGIAVFSQQYKSPSFTRVASCIITPARIPVCPSRSWRGRYRRDPQQLCWRRCACGRGECCRHLEAARWACHDQHPTVATLHCTDTQHTTRAVQGHWYFKPNYCSGYRIFSEND